MTHDPSPNPTLEPTTRMPTIAPTPQNVYCNQDGIATEIDSEYEYYLHIDEKSIVRFDTCETTNTFDMRITDTNSSANYSCVQCGSLCYTPSQYQVTLPSSIYVLHISGPHAFAMVCTPKVGTDAPTQYPTTTRPTTTSTAYPTPNPTTSRPTESDQPVFNVSFPGTGAPVSRFTFLGDPYGRFEAYIVVTVVDKDDVLGVTALCSTCFIWQYRLENAVWVDVDPTDDDISVYNKQMESNNGITTYQSYLTIQSIRRLNAARCVNTSHDLRIFEPGNVYELRHQFIVDDTYFVSAISDALSIETNTLPSGGFCIVQNLQNLKPLQPYNVFCDGWDKAENLEYNALLKDVLISPRSYQNDARKLTSIAPVGAVTITVLIKEMNVSDAITCYPIHAEFKG
eukprot:72107_1